MKTLLTGAGIIFFLDQLTKWIIVKSIPFGGEITVIPNFFDLVHFGNKGAAFGIFLNLPDPYRHIFLLAVAVVAVLAIGYYYLSLPPENFFMKIPLSMLMGGALGNICDRIFRGAVVDFLSFHWYDRLIDIGIGQFYWNFRLEWPAFNVADAAITVSVFWLVVMLSFRRFRG